MWLRQSIWEGRRLEMMNSSLCGPQYRLGAVSMAVGHQGGLGLGAFEAEGLTWEPKNPVLSGPWARAAAHSISLHLPLCRETGAAD